MTDAVRDILLAFVRVHVLHHAVHERVFGAGMMKELARHGYKLGPGTLYPLLHRLEADGLLSSEAEVVAGKQRRYYSATSKGTKALERYVPSWLNWWARPGGPGTARSPDSRPQAVGAAKQVA